MHLHQAWHATHPDNIPSIMTEGLIPNFGHIYVSDTAETAATFVALTLLLPRITTTIDGTWTTQPGTDHVALVRLNTNGIMFNAGTDHNPTFFTGNSYVTTTPISADRIVEIQIRKLLPANLPF